MKERVRPAMEEVKRLASEGGYGVIPVSMEIYSDITTTVEVLRKLKKVSRHVYLLESAEADLRWGRYSFLGYDPQMEINCYNSQIHIKTSMTSRECSPTCRHSSSRSANVICATSGVE